MQPELASEVRVYMPKTYLEAVEIARLRDDHLDAIKKGKKLTEFEQQVVGHEALTWDEMKRQRERGLCFNCDEKFTPGHKRKTKGLVREVSLLSQVGQQIGLELAYIKRGLVSLVP
ncbi:hypothetical protein ACS0TY_014810 [Phlomoides rotata]